MIAVKAENIEKNYGEVKALKGISLEIKQGELFGVIGPDGAGKTSLFRILTSLLLPDGGSARVNGYDVVKDFAAVRRSIGYMPGRFSLYMDLTIEENLNFFATLYGTTLEENYDLIKDIYSQIEPFKKRPAGKLSGGMKQKLALSCALIHKPSVLFLDEPSTGVDPVSRAELWEMLVNLKKQGITIIASTPYMDEAILCDRIALLQEGQCMQINTPANIIASFTEILWAVRSDRMYKLLTDLRNHSKIRTCFAFGDKHHITVEKDLTENELNNYLSALGYKEISIEKIAPSIEDCYISSQNSLLSHQAKQ